MNYWFGYRIFNCSIDSKAGEKNISEAFSSYEKAKLDRTNYDIKEFERTHIFEAVSKEKASEMMKSLNFNKL